MSQSGENAAFDVDLMTRQGRSFSGKERNSCFLNTKGQGGRQSPFSNISAVSGMDVPDDGRGLAVVDWDHDGDMDLWVTNRTAPRIRFFRNDSPNENGSLQLWLEANGQDTNRSAIGARVVIETSQKDADGNPVQLIKTVRAGESFISQSTRWLHFGLPKDVTVQSVSVTWPNANHDVETFSEIPNRGRAQLVQGTGKAKVLESPKRDMALSSAKVTVPVHSGQHRIPIIHKLPAPELGYFDFEGKPHPFKLDSDQVTLVNIWSSTCAPCLKELKEFSERHDELKRAGVRVLALSVDELETCDPKSKKDAEAVYKRFNMPFAAGMAPPMIVDELRMLHNILIKMERPLPLPTSFLFDREGRLDVIYKGTVSVDTLLKDAKPSSLSRLERFNRAACFTGSIIDDPVITQTLKIDESWAHVRIARELVSRDRNRQAIIEYEKALQNVPDSESVHNNLGNLYQLLGDGQKAASHFRTAVRLDPNNVGIRINYAQNLIGQKNFVMARQHLEEILKQSPENAKAYLLKAEVHTGQRDIDSAIECLQKSIQLDSRNTDAHFGLGNIYASRQEYDLAKKHFGQVLLIKPKDARTLVYLASLFMRERNLEEAERLTRLAIRYDSKNADAHCQLGYIFQQLGESQAAIQQFELVLKIDPKHVGARQAMQAAKPQRRPPGNGTFPGG